MIFELIFCIWNHCGQGHHASIRHAVWKQDSKPYSSQTARKPGSSPCRLERVLVDWSVSVRTKIERSLTFQFAPHTCTWLAIERSSFSMAAVARGGWMEVISGPKKIPFKVQKVQQVWLKTVTLMYVFSVCLFVCFFLSLILGTDVLAGYCKAVIFYGSRGTWTDGWKSFPGQKRFLSRIKKSKRLNFIFGFGSCNRRDISTMAESNRGSLAKIGWLLKGANFLWQQWHFADGWKSFPVQQVWISTATQASTIKFQTLTHLV